MATMSDRASRAHAADTRDRILAVAVQLFNERGYAGTSIRDIAERLGMTKAALYYHFASKDMILDAAVQPFVEAFGHVRDLSRVDPPASARSIIEGLVEAMAGPGAVLFAFVNDPSVIHRQIGKGDIASHQDAIVTALAGPEPTPLRILRARCAVGCVQAGILGTALERRALARAGADPAGTARTARTAEPGAGGVDADQPLVPEDVRREVVEAALDALGSAG
ncbi:TetR/AcrR family transcriptional regulator [Candidatus Protofrankia californiensis]|uniref:TetR/AcrR family transcriptional regulator n=1 Tax=Candidatus Protofrankia californiensis TaxID=1839754 RepID=UPI001F49C4CA|nr:TetR/AcrR family transcriptional regulator [Candidatus Protofrankia californiensis]